mmetsp:Transcript_5023/g.12853  ORF Transcript_5023/g.12853 Transcript_5023/m.12853 type:complete len:109 (+) Transcript_5023:320-646(+)
MESLISHPELAGVPLLVCANKMDLATARSVDEIDQYFQIECDVRDGNGGAASDEVGPLASRSLKAKRREKRLQAVSALTCSGIEEGITWLVDSAVNNPDIIRARSPGP